MKEIILNTIEDLVGEFVFYGRKEDEQLSIEQLNEAVSSGVITVDEMVNKFRLHLEATFNK